ncbi:FG-GAP repeat domain-containing protein [Desulfotalea psychrophila]|uniref:VCBS repeat-containing protein n=1 Tax=Desulfotalea psychrophila (strain LSv54 / DSM 12343) TaxID=177439 RepID=Q6AME9_DESPS|nr:VCBS repeat-containing protein [Desulfotalea psychrophila]CAG36476.1 unknown protein [Desulfotalea psychrophila LSv54]
MPRLFLPLFVALAVLFSSLPLWAEEEVAVSKVLFLPLDGTNAGKYSPLVNGIGSMLASQLASKDRIIAVDYNLKQQEIKALTVAGKSVTGQNLDIDYVVRGSVYALENGISLQVKVVPINGTGSKQNFSEKAAEEKDIFSAVDLMATKIGTDVFGYQEQAKRDVSAAMGMAGFATSHPEREYKKGLLSGGSLYGSNQLSTTVAIKNIRRTPKLPMEMVGMAVGDFNGDGQDDMVYASRQKLLFYTQKAQRFTQLGEYTLSTRSKINAISAADYDGDGRDELYISSNFGAKARSEILSITAGTVQPLMTIDGWYLQPIEKPGSGLLLLGQRGSTKRADSYLLPGVYQLDVAKDFSSFQKGEEISLPKGTTLFSFAWADLTANGKAELLVLDRRERLLIYDGDNQLLHVSLDNYGGSTNFFGIGLGKLTDQPLIGQNEDLDNFGNWNYIPTRIITTDIDGDGRSEIIVGSNRREEFVSSGREKEKKRKAKKEGKTDNEEAKGMVNAIFDFFPNMRSYEGGTVACLSYTDGALRDVWRTKAISGYIPDYSYRIATVKDEMGQDKEVVHLSIAKNIDSTFLGFGSSDESQAIVYEFSYKEQTEKP